MYLLITAQVVLRKLRVRGRDTSKRGLMVTSDEEVDVLTNDANVLHRVSASISTKMARKHLKKDGIWFIRLNLGLTPAPVGPWQKV